MKTLDGEPMSSAAATQAIGAALQIAPGFVAQTSDEESGIETTVEAHYDGARGRYVITSITNRATRPDFDESKLRHTAPQALIQSAIPHCIALLLDDNPDAKRTTIADLTGSGGRIIPEWMAEAVVKRGVRDERWEVVEILYGTAALADLPPVKLVARELSVPERTASDWIGKARAAGWLVGLTSNVGRPVSG